MNKTLVAIATAGSLLVSLSAFANKGAQYHEHHNNDLDWSKGWYVGAGVNSNAEGTMNLNGSPEVFDHISGMSSMDEVEQNGNNVGFDLYVGRDINKHWAVELGYTYVGTINFDGEIAGIVVEEIEVKQWNMHLVGIGKLPIGEYFNVFAKGGAAYFSSSQEFETVSSGAEVTDTIHTMALTYGAGIEVTWNHWGIRGEYNVIWPASNVRDDFYVADVISGNVYYKFM